MACEQTKVYGPYGDKEAKINYDFQVNPKTERLSVIQIRSGYILDAIGFGKIDTSTGKVTPPEMHGGKGGAVHEIVLQLGENVIGISGKSKNSQISQLMIYTDHCQTGYGPYGTNPHGLEFKSPDLADDETIVKFFGSANDEAVASIGFYTQKDD